MSIYEQLQAEIQDRQRQIELDRQAAQVAERQRVAQEQAPRQAIAQAEAELQSLQRRAVEAAHFERMAQHQHILTDLRQCFADITQALSAGDFKTARAARDRALALATQAEAMRASTTTGAMWTADEQQQYRRMVADPSIQDQARAAFQPIEIFVNQRISDQHLRPNTPELPATPDLFQHLAGWIAACPVGSAERDERAGLAYIVTRRLLDSSLVIINPGQPMVGPTR